MSEAQGGRAERYGIAVVRKLLLVALGVAVLIVFLWIGDREGCYGALGVAWECSTATGELSSVRPVNWPSARGSTSPSTC